MKYRKIEVVLISAQGYDIAREEADTMKQARERAKYFFSDDYPRSCETTHDNWQTEKVQILGDGVCVWDKWRTMPQVSDYFTPGEVGPLPDNYAGHVLIMRPTAIKAGLRSRGNLLWRADGGFGCDVGKIGRAVFATCIGDGESARWDRSDFAAEFLGDVEPERGNTATAKNAQ